MRISTFALPLAAPLAAGAVALALVAACGDEPSVAGADAGATSAPPGSGASLGADAGGVDVLWIGAHPDDEIYLAPLLADRCLADKQRCRLLVLTRGEAGSCKRPAACAPDLPSARAAEMQRSALRLGAELEAWDLGDGKGASPEAVVAAWAAKEGGEEALVARMRRALEAARPRTVYVFDPRHGSSCHPDHRAAGALAIATIQRAAIATELVLVETTVAADADAGHAGYVAAVPADIAVVRTPADAPPPGATASGWSVLVDVLGIHASQFTDAELAALASAPPALQATYWLRASAADASDGRYAALCK